MLTRTFYRSDSTIPESSKIEARRLDSHYNQSREDAIIKGKFETLRRRTTWMGILHLRDKVNDQ